DPRARQRSDLAHGAIHGRYDDLGVGIHGTRACAQRAGEELVEAGVAERIRLGRLTHVGPEPAQENRDERVLDPRRPDARQSKHQARKEMLRKDFLQRDEQRVAHQPFLLRSGAAVRRSWAICLASNGGVKTATSRAWASSRKTVAE